MSYTPSMIEFYKTDCPSFIHHPTVSEMDFVSDKDAVSVDVWKPCSTAPHKPCQCFTADDQPLQPAMSSWLESPPAPNSQALPRWYWQELEAEPEPDAIPPPPTPAYKRVRRDIIPSQVYPSKGGHCPGRVAFYTLYMPDGMPATLQLQTWSGILRQYRFWPSHVSMVYTESVTQDMPYTIVGMRRGYSPIKILFESWEEADECQMYLFNIIGH